MYAFVIMVMLNGTPHYIIMDRGLSAAQCQEMAERPDSGLRIEGKKADGAGRCIPEEKVPSLMDPVAFRP